MTQPTIEELRRALELLRDIDQLIDESVRARMQTHVLNLLEPTHTSPTPLVVPVVEPDQPSRLLKPSTIRPRRSSEPRADSDRGRLYYALKELASALEPLSVTDLEPLVPTVPTETISKALSSMYKERMVERKQVTDRNRANQEVEIFKYWVPEEV